MKFFTALVLLISLQKSTLCSLCNKVTSIPFGIPTKIGYSPHWDRKTGRLLLADQYSTNAKICQFDYNLSKTFCALISGEEYASSIIPVEGSTSKFVVALSKSIKVVEWNGKSTTACVSEEIFRTNPKDSNFMDTAKADPTGRLYFGTYGAAVCGSPSNSSLFSYSPKEGVRLVHTGFKSCFGLAFNNITNKCYFMDSCSFSISEFDWDRNTGKLRNHRVFYTFDVIPGKPIFIPFGLDFDSDNNFYVGLYGLGKLLKIKPNLEEDNCKSVEEIEVPSKLVGCPTFGGPDLTDIFITTSALYLDLYTGKTIETNSKCTRKLVENVPEDGSLLRIEQVAVKGVPANNVRL